MSLVNGKFIILILGVFIPLLFLFLKQEFKFNNWVYLHWFLKRKKISMLSLVLTWIGFLLLTMSLLDLRGKEEIVTGKVSKQRTIILIDSSASMLAEDIRPNRYKKAILLARHFVKRAAGQQIAIVTFSDIQKLIVPFTNDVDLLDSRLTAMEDLDITTGSTNLNTALKESLQYFKRNSDDPHGNILIFTDAEANEGNISLNISENTTVGVIGVGTRKGSNIPLRSKSGVFQGVKKHNGKPVHTKLDEQFLKSWDKKIKHFKYWITTSYSLPTDDILKFFNKKFDAKKSKDDVRIRPVLVHYFMIPGILLIIFGNLFRFGKQFTATLFILGLFGFNGSAISQEVSEAEKKKIAKEEKSLQRIEELKNAYRADKLPREGMLELAEEYMVSNQPEKASDIYQDTLGDTELTKSNYKDYFNSASADFSSGKIKEGLRKFKEVEKFLETNNNENSKKIKEAIKNNRLTLIKQQQKKKKQEEQNKKDKKKQKNKDQNKSNSSKNKNKDKKDGQQDKKDKKDKNDNKNKDKNKKDQKKSDDQKKKDQKNNKDQNDNNKNKNEQKNKPEHNKKRLKKKLPAMLKNLKNGDSKIQRKKMKTSLGGKRRKLRKQKDW